MIHHEGIRRYAGICAGGPYDGMMQAHPMPTFRVSEDHGIQLSVGLEIIPASLFVKTGTYEFCPGRDCRQGEWRWKGWS